VGIKRVLCKYKLNGKKREMKKREKRGKCNGKGGKKV
jgi:hypothetical protein